SVFLRVAKAPLLEQPVDLAAGDGPAERGERAALLDLARDVEKSSPRGPREAAADADAADAGARQVADGERRPRQHVHRPWRHRLDDRGDLVERRQPRRVEAL